jgi:hypothetical protein
VSDAAEPAEMVVQAKVRTLDIGEEWTLVNLRAIEAGSFITVPVPSTEARAFTPGETIELVLRRVAQ